MSCSYCKKNGHTKADCFKLKKREQTSPQPASPTSLPAVKASSSSVATVATIQAAITDKLEISSPVVKIIKLDNNHCSLNALIDTGSPASFIKHSVLKDIRVESLKYSAEQPKRFRSMNGIPLEVFGVIQSEIVLDKLPTTGFSIDFHVLFVMIRLKKI